MKRPARIAAICLTVGGGAVTLLLWAKLKLVTGIPRTVYAEPQVAQDPRDSQPEGADTSVQPKDDSGDAQALTENHGLPTK